MPDRASLDEIRRAAVNLSGPVLRTPLVPLQTRDGSSEILLKLETLQPVTNFKIRGVFNAVAMLTEEERSRGLGTVSAGNTAQALAWTGRHFGVAARSLMPDSAPRTKIETVERYGGTPVLVPVDELFRFLRERGWEREPYAFIHPWTNRDLMIGHGTIGLEILEDLPGAAEVYVPVGGGGLIAGVGSALKSAGSEARVIAVEPEGCPALHESLRRGAPASVECRTMCDGVAVPYITDEMFPLLREVVDEVVLVSEERVRETVRRLALRERLIVEPSAALSVAAAVRGLSPKGTVPGGVVAIVTGASIDREALVEILG